MILPPVANLQWLRGRRKRSRAVRAGALDARLMPAVTMVGLQLDTPAPARRTRLMRRRTRRGRRGTLAFGRWRHEQVSWNCHGRGLRRRESALHARAVQSLYLTHCSASFTHLTRTLTQGISIDSLMRPGLTAASALPSSACALVRILVRTWQGASKIVHM